MPEHENDNPLLKEVPGHLFSFEEKIFGMTLPQLLSDIGAALAIASMTGHVPFVPRVVLCMLLGTVVLIVVHARVRGYTMLVWLSLLVRFALLPRQTVWRLHNVPREKGDSPSVQDTWMRLTSLDRGIMGYTVPHRKQSEPNASFWVVFSVESVQNVHFLPKADQVRFYGRIKSLLDGLGSTVKFLSLVQDSDPAHDPALLAQKKTEAELVHSPQLQKVQRATIAVQQQQSQFSTNIKHYVVVSASRHDVAHLRPNGSVRSPLDSLISLFTAPRPSRSITRAQVMDVLRTRVSILRKAFGQLDVHATLLDDAQALEAFSSCLALGAHVPSFEVSVDDSTEACRTEQAPALLACAPTPRATHEESGRAAEEQGKMAHTPAPSQARRRPWKKRIRGMHRTFVYNSSSPRTRFEEGVLLLSDLLAPTAVTLHHDSIQIDACGQSRYQRYFEITGFGSDLLGGWQEELTALGLPLILTTRCEPLDSRMMIKKLELHLTKLESARIIDKKHERILKSAQMIEGEQVRSVMDALARKKLTIYAVQLVIGIHAGSPQRLEQRSDFLLSHLHTMQLSARALARRHDVAWQTCLPSCIDGGLDFFTNLPSDVLATFVNWSRGTVGTPSGAYLGTTGSGTSKHPVFFNPWDVLKRLANPHVTICGESGKGKSWLVKLIILGLLCNRIADAVVLDRDGDYDAIHDDLKGESQRFNLAGTIPINLLDIPYGPSDVNPADKIDLLAEFIDNHLLVGMALLYGEALSQAQESFLTAAARTAYARRGITCEAMWRDPNTLLKEPPVFAELLAAMRDIPAASETVRAALIERFENVAYLFAGQTTVHLGTPLTIFNIKEMDKKWYPLLVYVIQTFLTRHRKLKRDERYLAFVIEEASYMLKHSAGKRYLEDGSRGYRKLGIALFIVSQLPDDFLEEGRVIMANSATNFFLGMQRHAAQKLGLAEDLERVVEEADAGQAVMRCGREYAVLDVTRGSKLHQDLLTTNPEDQREIRKRQQQSVVASPNRKDEVYA